MPPLTRWRDTLTRFNPCGSVCRRVQEGILCSPRPYPAAPVGYSSAWPLVSPPAPVCLPPAPSSPPMAATPLSFTPVSAPWRARVAFHRLASCVSFNRPAPVPPASRHHSIGISRAWPGQLEPPALRDRRGQPGQPGQPVPRGRPERRGQPGRRRLSSRSGSSSARRVSSAPHSPAQPSRRSSPQRPVPHRSSTASTLGKSQPPKRRRSARRSPARPSRHWPVAAAPRTPTSPGPAPLGH